MGKIRQRWDEREKERKIVLGHKKENFLINQKMTFTFLSLFPSKENKPSPHVAIVSYFKKDEKEAGRPKI